MRAFVGVGSNLGDRWANLALAARELRREPRLSLVRASRVWDAAPLGPPQPRVSPAGLAGHLPAAPGALSGAPPGRPSRRRGPATSPGS